MKNWSVLAFILLFLVAGCASPATTMSDQQVASLSDDDLCTYVNNYRSEPRTSALVKRRGLNCDRHYRECLKQGNKPETKAMSFCVDTLKENERLRAEPAYDHFNVFPTNDYTRIRQGGAL